MNFFLLITFIPAVILALIALLFEYNIIVFFFIVPYIIFVLVIDIITVVKRIISRKNKKLPSVKEE